MELTAPARRQRVAMHTLLCTSSISRNQSAPLIASALRLPPAVMLHGLRMKASPVELWWRERGDLMRI